MPAQQKAKSGHKPNLAAKARHERYRREGRRERNKIKRIARSNGHAAAVAYARAYLLSDWATKAGII